MDISTLLRFKGYTKTPFIFSKHHFFEFEQIELRSQSEIIDDSVEFKNQRLGKLVEEFVFYQLKQDHTVEWVLENLQIQKERKTIGELDAIYSANGKPVHLEIVYKFYLYDTLHSYSNPLAYWIGPNRKDTLNYKLNKLKTKQFPLIFNKTTHKQLLEHNINMADIKQQLCFKAQLFLPYHNSKINIAPLNPNSVSGFYQSFKAISIFKDLEFFIPKKLDWLIETHQNVKWQPYEEAIKTIEQHIEVQHSPLVWLKYNDTSIKKCFITWW